LDLLDLIDMAVRNENEYGALYGQPSGTEFPDNTTGLITETKMRNFGQDNKDSLVFKTTLLGPSTTGVAFIFCGNADLSSDLFPTTGGTGTAGAIKKGNSFRVSVSTTGAGIGGTIIDVNTEIIALVDTPGQTLANWWIRI